jgi:hypothetical protein
MADPLSIVAIIGLALAGRNLSMKHEIPQGAPRQQTQQAPQAPLQNDNMTIITNSLSGHTTNDLGVSGLGTQLTQKTTPPNFADIVPTATADPHGMPVQDFRDRPYVSGQMNNLTPVQKQLVGPGLGLSADVPAYGGYQQLFRVNPNNVGAYKLTTLPGRVAPAGDITGGMPGKVGQLTHNAPSTVAFLPSRRPNVEGRGQELTSMTWRGKQEKTKRQTNRAETTMRSDGLEYAPAKSIVSALTQAEDPTRNKGDLNTQEFYHVDNPTPGIANFIGGYTNAPGSELLAQKPQGKGASYSPAQLEAYGFRPDERRGKKNRKGNAGRMNVRAGPLNANGAITSVRKDSNKYDGRVNPVAGGWTQNYVQSEFYQLNPYKGQENPRTSNRGLNIAKKQLANNPLAHTIS